MAEHNGQSMAWNCGWACPTIARRPALPGEMARVWVCVRVKDGGRLVTDADCRDCPFWERLEEPESRMW